MKTWISIPENNDFSIYNIPFGIFSEANNPKKRAATILGNNVIDISALYMQGFLNDISEINHSIFAEDSLNTFLALGNLVCENVRKKIQSIFTDENSKLKSDTNLQSKIIFSVQSVSLHMPIKVQDYVDFYSSISHATNVGKMFRDDKNPLLPNWKHLPIGYHGRASSIIPSGTNIKRPWGQLKKSETAPPIYAPSERIDFELEVAFVTNKINSMGNVLSPKQSAEHIFGLTLFNDWSARDIQKWEYVPLGPFLGKSFASTISPWIVSLEALKPFAIDAPKKETPELEYLQCSIKGHYDINLEVYIQPKNSTEEYLLCKSNYKHLYWNMFQQLAYLASNGSPINVGDMCASGTISGDDPSSFGSLLELSWGGKNPIKLPNGESRSFIQNGDTIIMKGYAQKDEIRVGFGEARAMIFE